MRLLYILASAALVPLATICLFLVLGSLVIARMIQAAIYMAL